MNKENNFGSSDQIRRTSSSHLHHPNSCPEALSYTDQLGTGPDELSGHFIVDDFSLTLCDHDGDNISETRDSSLLAEHYERISPSDEVDLHCNNDLAESDNSLKIKSCIETEYMYVIRIDHSRLAEELAKRTSELNAFQSQADPSCGTANARSFNGEPVVERRTPLIAVRSATKKMLTGESIRKLFRVMSPANLRNPSSELHSSGSSVSVETLTGSKGSFTVDGDLPSTGSHVVELTQSVAKQRKKHPSDGSSRT